MNKSDIMVIVEEIFRELFDEYDGSVSPDLTAGDVAQWDSLGHIQLMVMIEKTMKLRFKIEEISQLNNLGELVDLIHEKTAG